jgi:hypothetical protein
MDIGKMDSQGPQPRKGDPTEAAKQVMKEVDDTASRLMQVDDKVDVDLNPKKGEVKVRKAALDPSANDIFTGKLSYDPASGKKSDLNVDVFQPMQFQHIRYAYDKDHQDIPIFGKKMELFEKRIPDPFSMYRTHVQAVRIDETGKMKYSDYIEDLTPPPQPPPPPPPPPYPPHGR